MIYTLLVGLTFIAFFLGFYLRETLDTLHKGIDRLDALKSSQDKDKKPEASFAEPMSRAQVAAMLEEERIDLLNPK